MRATSAVTTIFIFCSSVTGGFAAVGDQMNMPGMNMPGMQQNSGKRSPSSSMPGMQMPPAASPGQGMDMGMDMGSSQPQVPAPPLIMPSGHLEFNEVPELPRDAKNYTLQDFEKLAIDHNPTLIQAKAQIDGERGKARQAGIWPNPFMAYSGDLMGAPGNGLGEFQGGVAGQDIILGGKLKYSRRKYEARASAAEQQAIAQEWRVRNDIHISFVHVLAASERLALTREMFKSITDHWLTTNEMFNMGQANQMSLRQANIDIALQRARVFAAQNGLDLAWQELTTVAGIDVPLATVAGALETKVVQLTFNNLLTNLIEHSPEVGEAKDKLRSDEIMVAREHRQPIPNLTVCGGPGYDQIDGGVVARAGLAVTNIPLWNRNQGTIQQAEADLSRQKAQVRLVELNLRRELAEHYNRFRTAGQFVQTYKDVVIPESRAKYEVALHSYKDVRMEWPDVLAAQRQYIDARLDYINHLVEYRESEIEIHGFLLTGGLVPPPGVTPPGHIDATPQPR
jgi:outer membrane protein TolC